MYPAFHSITGSDTTSYLYNVGKVRPFRKMTKSKTCTSNLLINIGRNPVNYVDAVKFMQVALYPGKESESFIETRIRMYEDQKVKSSKSLLPDLNSATQHIRRSNYQTEIWMQCTNQDITYQPLDQNSGWTKDENDNIRPIWYTCSQLPPEHDDGIEGESPTIY